MFALVGFVGLVDSQVPHIIFSIFYLVPVYLATWYVNRTTGIVSAVAAAAFGLVADIWSTQTSTGYAITNSGLRLILFTVAALTFGRLGDAIRRERDVAEREREAAARLAEAAALRAELIRAVAHDAREPLGQIYARVVDLGFDFSSAQEGDSRAVLNEIAQASVRLSKLVDSLLREDRELVTAFPSGSGAPTAAPRTPPPA